MKIRFELFEDTADLRKALESANWIFEFEVWGDKNYMTEINDETFYKVEFEDGCVVITDDLAIALGEVEE